MPVSLFKLHMAVLYNIISDKFHLTFYTMLGHASDHPVNSIVHRAMLASFCTSSGMFPMFKIWYKFDIDLCVAFLTFEIRLQSNNIVNLVMPLEVSASLHNSSGMPHDLQVMSIQNK